MNIDLEDHERFLERRPSTQGLSIAPWYAALVARYGAILAALREDQNVSGDYVGPSCAFALYGSPALCTCGNCKGVEDGNILDR